MIQQSLKIRNIFTKIINEEKITHVLIKEYHKNILLKE